MRKTKNIIFLLIYATYLVVTKTRKRKSRKRKKKHGNSAENFIFFQNRFKTLLMTKINDFI